MATWSIEQTDTKVELIYLRHAGAHPQDCGQGPIELLPELMGWAFEQAEVWDKVEVGGGTFFRQAVRSTRLKQ